MSPTEPIEGQPVTATLWNDAAGTIPFDEPGATDIRYTWWAGEGDTVDTIGEWEVLSQSQIEATYTPTQEAVGQFLRVTVSYIAANGEFRTAQAAVSTAPVQDVPAAGALVFTAPSPSVGQFIAAGIPTDGDGIAEESVFTYVWSWSATDPAIGATWVDYVDAEGEQPADLPEQARGVAVDALAARGTEGATPALIELLGDTETTGVVGMNASGDDEAELVRDAALAALSRITGVTKPGTVLEQIDAWRAIDPK